MKRTFVVVGLGTFGIHTAHALHLGGADVLAIDTDEQVVAQAGPMVTRAVCADATNEEVMTTIGAFDADCAVVAIRKRFDTTVLVTHMFKRAGMKQIVVQVDSDSEKSAIEAVGATQSVFVERDMAERASSRLLLPDLADQIALGANVAVIEMPVTLELAGKSLMEIDLRRKFGVTVIALKKPGEGGPEVIDISPAADAPLTIGTILVTLGESENLTRFRDKFR
ncbi:hypothetical protein CVU37_13740 [candidate division BRC1 bacterium HGW-BRC1-1]|jgi:trk system potassium uptake protein TrkA|nr:MAG: hypothetical protein CVU37_13740 [candidate division BRC1 bacterium HGW-BRC1-1]